MQICFAWKSLWSCSKESRTARLLSPPSTGSRAFSRLAPLAWKTFHQLRTHPSQRHLRAPRGRYADLAGGPPVRAAGYEGGGGCIGGLQLFAHLDKTGHRRRKSRNYTDTYHVRRLHYLRQSHVTTYKTSKCHRWANADTSLMLRYRVHVEAVDIFAGTKKKSPYFANKNPILPSALTLDVSKNIGRHLSEQCDNASLLNK